MTPFQDRIRAALAKPSPSQAPNALPPEFEQVLVEFVQTLEEARPSLQAEIETEGRTHSLVTFPRYRRNEKTTILIFRWNGSVVRIAMGEDQDFEAARSPDDLREFLVRLVNDFAIRSTIDEYEEVCKEEVVAFLQSEPADILTMKAVMVAVSAEEQRRIATATSGKSLTVRVRPMPTNPDDGMGVYKPSKEYRWLGSGGYELRIIEHREEGEDIVITGSVVQDEAVDSR